MKKTILFALMMLCTSIILYAPEHEIDWRISYDHSNEKKFMFIDADYGHLYNYGRKVGNTNVRCRLVIREDNVIIIHTKIIDEDNNNINLCLYEEITGRVRIMYESLDDYEYYESDNLKGGYLFNPNNLLEDYNNFIEFLKKFDGKNLRIGVTNKNECTEYYVGFGFNNNGFNKTYNELR